MNRTDKECQPCDAFDPEMVAIGDGMYEGRHECYSPADDGTRPCEGYVTFCNHCCCDHHSGGYNTCAGTWHDGKGACSHPACVARREARTPGEGGDGR